MVQLRIGLMENLHVCSLQLSWLLVGNFFVGQRVSSLDNETQKCLENSVVYYVKMNGVAVLWVLHNKDIAERLLTP
jgi:ABC-type iron transport system FetAB ATPase subunit